MAGLLMQKTYLGMAVTLAAVLAVSASLAPASWATEFSFARSTKGIEIITGDKVFFERLSQADINLRLGSESEDKTLEELKAAYAGAVREWTLEEVGKLGPVLSKGRKLLAPYEDLLPETIYLVKVTDGVDGGLPHTRGDAIFLAPDVVSMDVDLFLHEVFHILSRNLGNRQAELYQLLGFRPCTLEKLKAFERQRLTNPDSPPGDYYIPIEHDGASVGTMPIIYSRSVTFDASLRGGFAGHIQFGLMKVNPQDGTCKVMRTQNNSIIWPVLQFPEYYEAIGKNTDYIIHPEEVLADNFVMLLTEAKDLPNPEIPEKLGAWLAAQDK